MNSGEILYSEGKNDECYTPAYGVEPILKYIPENAVVWCPFDTEESEFVKQISKTHKVIKSHIKDGQDFYTYEPEEEWDCIVSNPPFCFSEDTQLLTKTGWKFFNEINKDDEVLSCSEKQEISWSKIVSINVKKNDEDLLRFKSKYI